MSDKEEKDVLEGLNYDRIVLEHNAHRLTGNLTKYQQGMKKDVPVDEGAVWLVTGLGYLKEETPDQLIQHSLDDTIIVSKTELIKFIEEKSK